MYQTVGHTLIPLYAEILAIPLYRQEISGTAVNQSKEYSTYDVSQSLDVDVEETESMMTLLQRIKADYPEANAVCSGAILSSYQRTRIESVARRMGLVPLAYLWQYPVLPVPVPSEGGLLDDMAAVGIDARIVKVASGGLDESLLWENVCTEPTRKLIAKAVKRFGGSVLGEGGEFETLVVNGPRGFFKGSIEVGAEQRTTTKGGGGEASLRFAGGTVLPRRKCQDDDAEWLGKLRIPSLLDGGFEGLLETVNREVDRTPALTSGLLSNRKQISGQRAWVDKYHICTRRWTTHISNLSASHIHDSTQAQMEEINRNLLSLLEHNVLRSTADIIFTTILLRSADDFQAVNQKYAELFGNRPNPPARVTVSCGDMLPPGVNVMVSVVIALGPDVARQRLHVQSISYWAPANIGPYSQAASVRLGDEDNAPAIVYIAGQIPLVPSTMEIVTRLRPAGESEGEQDAATFRLQTTLALQHLWRIGTTMDVSWWIGAVAFVVADEDDIKNKACVAALAWTKIHIRERDSGLTQESAPTDNTGFDVWNERCIDGWSFTPERENTVLPDFSCLSVHSEDGMEIPRGYPAVSPFFTVQVAQLPRDSPIEWQGLGAMLVETYFAVGEPSGYVCSTLDMSTDVDSSIPRIDDGPGGQGHTPKDPPRLSRSPHQYTRRHSEVSSATLKLDDRCDPNSSPTSNVTCKSNIAKTEFVDSDNRKRRKDSTTPSDSGSEADDESGPLLKSLPAPPLRLRKGLKNESALGTPSPLLTPSYLDDEKRRASFEASFKRRASLQSHTSTDEETLAIKDKFRKRRRAELLRRLTETALLLCIGLVACWKTLLLPLRQDVTTAVLIICGTYSSYPFRLFNYHRRLPLGARASRRFLQIPAAFDPATLLYPVLLPIFVAGSLLSSDRMVMTMNLSLGVASMPRLIVPRQDSFSGHTSVQWMLSVLPIAPIGTHADLSMTSVRMIADPEILALLYPLHQALLPTLGYLTTTSLLPSELQLLSVSLINVLFLSSSPQAVILQALLWGGGLSLFVLCQRVLEWEVALARIPSWRFRRHSSDHVFRSVVNRLIGRLPHQLTHAVGGGPSESSDSDEPQRFEQTQPRRRPRGLSSGNVNEDRVLSKVRTAMPQLPMQLDGCWSTSQGGNRRERSHTLPLNTGQAFSTTSGSRKGSKPHNPTSFWTKPQNFRSLTKAQARAATWLLALYVYTVVIMVIAIPLRLYIAACALYNQEPIGWALGYLLGDTRSVRSTAVTLGLGQWIRIPNNYISMKRAYGWAEEVRWQRLGAANTRLLICLHCVSTIGLGLAVVFRLSGFADVDTRRKVFHGMMVVMFLPTIFVDPTFVGLALSLILAIFLILDLFRASQLPPLSRPLTNFLAPYVDGRDHRGPVIVSHIFLLIGCSIPLWLSLAAVERSTESPWPGWEVPRRDLSMISGVVCVGMGDAAASLMGRRYGKRRWCWSGGKSLEGSAAFAAAVTVGLGVARLWLLYGGWEGDGGLSWPSFFCKALVAAGGASVTEAVLTGGNDNVIVPIVLWLLVRGLGI
ncbi:MAG: hypothetical protein Q9169_005804 [Polycauliona sp. 2 TL-2023]